MHSNEDVLALDLVVLATVSGGAYDAGEAIDNGLMWGARVGRMTSLVGLPVGVALGKRFGLDPYTGAMIGQSGGELVGEAAGFVGGFVGSTAHQLRHPSAHTSAAPAAAK